MPFGWTGKILRVDLSSGKSWTEDTEPYTRLFVGGKGINVKIMYDEVGPQVGPFDPDNRVCFGPGVLAGTMAPSHSRMKVTSVSPNGLLQNSGIGGYVPAMIRKAGYDNLIIQGKSEKPIYLSIDDDTVEIKDATHIWGKDTQEAQRILKAELGDRAHLLCIGPAGENLVSFSGIVTGKGSSAARGGFGAILGSKNLKAIVAQGTGRIKIARPAEFMEACKEVHQFLPESSPFLKMQAKDGHGCKYTLGFLHEAGCTFPGNWEEKDASWDRIGTYGAKEAEEFYDKHASHQYGCFGCPVHHFHIFDVAPGRTGTTKCTQLHTFSHTVWNVDRRVLVQANTLCQDLGLDSTATGNAVSFLMELYHRGIITEKDTDGIPMNRGDEKAIYACIEKIGKQIGFGELFRNGVGNAAQKIGKEAVECAVVVNKQEMEPLEYRVFKEWALAGAVNDGSISHSEPMISVMSSLDKDGAEVQSVERFGCKEAAVPTSYEGKAKSVWAEENLNTACDLLGTCRWVIPWGYTYKLDMPARLFSLASGREKTEDDLLWTAQRVLSLERAFRVKRGIRRDSLPERLFEAAVPDGKYKGEKLDREKFEKMLDDYYELRGWNKEGIPTEETLKKFDLLPDKTPDLQEGV